MSANEKMPVSLTVNGFAREGYVEPRRTLADFLRVDLQLTGTHLGCEHGVCGACTVIVDGRALRSCLMLAVQAEGANVTTVEGVAGDNGGVHPVQQAFKERHSFQCGFCAPGIVMATVSFLNENPSPTEGEIRAALSSNLCRCTGYQSIVEGVKLASQMLDNGGGS
jgi:aerobic-type carbon monoxide dehydrogenase small subunit (CoxS/CutS family)